MGFVELEYTDYQARHEYNETPYIIFLDKDIPRNKDIQLPWNVI